MKIGWRLWYKLSQKNYIIYELYDLTSNEIEIIEKSVK